jgi:hypothetical protein
MDSTQKLREQLAPYFLSFDGTRQIGRGTAFPASADLPGGLQDGDRFYRSDLGWPCYYDLANTRWLTAFEMSADFTPNPLAAAPTTAAPNDLLLAPMRQDYNILITRMAAVAFVSTTNNGSNYYELQLRTSSGLAITTWNTSAGAANTFLTQTAAVGGAYAVPYFIYRTNAKTGAPGSVFISGTFWHRMIVT